MGQKLGQHFLTRPEIAGWVADAVPLTKDDVVLEIGPGEGILTTELLRRVGTVVAVEKDPALIAKLRERFADEITNARLILVEEDIRNFNPASHYSLQPITYSLIANIPYYITGAIMRQFLTTEHQPKNMVLLVQKEVAERVVAKNGKESLLSLSVKAYGSPKYVKTVKAGSFSPPPKVDSAILAIENISRQNFKNMAQEKRFFEILHAGFGSRRKVLASQLKKLGINSTNLERCGVPKSARAEDIPLERWMNLIKTV